VNKPDVDLGKSWKKHFQPQQGATEKRKIIRPKRGGMESPYNWAITKEVKKTLKYQGYGKREARGPKKEKKKTKERKL